MSLKCQRYRTFTLPHQQIFIEFSIFGDFFPTVCNAWLVPGLNMLLLPPPHGGGGGGCRY